VALDVDDELRGLVLVERDLAEPRGRAGLQYALLPLGIPGQEPIDAVVHAHLHEHALLQLHRRERAHEVEQHLRLAEREEAALTQREVEPADNLTLRLVVEVHQRVAAEQQVDPRNRRVIEQVVAAEDHAAAQVLLEYPSAGRLVEVLVAQLGRQCFDLAVGVGRLAGGVQLFLVHVGRVDLDAVAELFPAHRLGKQDRDRVAFLARRAAGAPDADLAGGGLRVVDHRRHDVARQEVERLTIAEERRDVDQDRVEQLGELVLVDLEIVEVRGVGVDPDRGHPLVDAARERCPFVRGEVEPAGVLQVFEEALEFRGRRIAVFHSIFAANGLD
jgi:hypothetical protein